MLARDDQLFVGGPESFNNCERQNFVSPGSLITKALPGFNKYLA
jgi:hypothetical protein